MLEMGVWQPACLLPPRISNGGRRKSTSLFSVFFSLKECSALGQSQNPQREKYRDICSLCSHSLTFFFFSSLPTVQKGMFYSREGLRVIGQSDMSPPLENCLAESIKLTRLLSDCIIQMYISKAELEFILYVLLLEQILDSSYTKGSLLKTKMKVMSSEKQKRKSDHSFLKSTHGYYPIQSIFTSNLQVQ